MRRDEPMREPPGEPSRGPWSWRRHRHRSLPFVAALVAAAVGLVLAPAAHAVSPPPTVRTFEDLPPRPGYLGVYPEDLTWSDSDSPGCATVQDVPHAPSPTKVFRHFCDPLVIMFVRPQAYVALRVNPQPFPFNPPPPRMFVATLQAFNASGGLVAERVIEVREGVTSSFFVADPFGLPTISVVTYDMTGEYSDIDDLAYSPFPQPDADITEAPAPLTASDTARFAFAATPGATLACNLDGDETACASPRTFTGLAEGAHTLTVTATDSYGARDATPARATWTVDRTAPDTTIDEGPPAATLATTATFRFSSGEAAAFECRLDTARFAACTSPVQLTGLSPGVHDYEVRATDAAGNTDPTPARRSWEVQADTDGDGRADAADNCPTVPNPGQADADGDRIGDACEGQDRIADRDGDGVRDERDNCPGTANGDQADRDRDDIGDACEMLPPGDAPPVAGRTTVVEQLGGEVYVRLPRGAGAARRMTSAARQQSGFVPLKGVASIPVGSVVDARKGRLALTTAANYLAPEHRLHRVQRARFAAAIFTIRQARRRRAARRAARAATDLVLRTPPGMSRACASRRTRPIKGIVRTLSSSGKGLFRAVGGASTTATNPRTTVTVIVQDRCNGTITSVGRGRARVFDRRLKRTVVVRAGREYIARARLFGARTRRG